MTRSSRQAKLVRIVGGFAVLAFLAACSAPGPQQSARQETARYLAHAKRSYTPPGPPEDPWGPYVREASAKYDMPESWIRAVMRQESGGKQYMNGELITSNAGAMGLMQVMPGTYEELRDRHRLGDDPFDPHDNILAGVAYMREMYDIYGSPGFLAAYNAGPARLDDYLTNTRPLPDETRRYVAAIGPNLYGAAPNVRSPAEQYAMNALPMNIPPGTRYGRSAVQLASATTRGPVRLAANTSSGGWNYGGGRVPAHQPVQVAQLPEPPPRAAPPLPPQQVAMATPPASQAAPSPFPSPTPSRGFHLVSPALAADSMAIRRGSAAPGQWAIQVGAFASQNLAHSALATARDQAKLELAVGRSYVGTVQGGRGTLWRARMVGLSKETAVQACEKLSRGRGNCIVLSPDAQS